MRGQTETLRVGGKAPQFTLEAVNRTGGFSLADLVRKGPVVVEFLRGTW